jgi:bifunctional DNA-binding transcriptional regulator/antitoxin component of YhaV-PrlF toxin-antitoxin module
MTYATLSSKNQITLPVEYLRGLGLKPKDRLEIREEKGQLILRRAPDFFALKGFLKGHKAPKDLRGAMMDAVAEHVIGRRR